MSGLTRRMLALLLAGVGSLVGCENIVTDFGPQPAYVDEHEHKPMLNVFGVLRPDAENGKVLSFVHLERSFPYAVGIDTILVTDAIVRVMEYEEGTLARSIELGYTDMDETFPTMEYRRPDFIPKSGQTYGISCVREGYPELTSSTTVPSAPEIVDDSVRIEPSRLSFSMLRDSRVGLYDIYLFTEQNVYIERIRRPEVGNIQVEMGLDAHLGAEGLLVIYAYDLQLSEYIAYNISIKPNTYRSDYSTVENGFGCFGSLNVLERPIVF